LQAVQTAIIGAPGKLLPWHYPPSFLLLALPLAWLPYLGALTLWLAATLGAALAVLRRIAPHPLTLALALAFPGLALNLFYCQGAFLVIALLGGGLLLLERRPWLAGLLFALLITYKPHLGLVVWAALAAGRRWPALGLAALAAVGLAGLSAAVFGLGVWEAFWRNLPFVQEQLETAADLWPRMPTVYAAARLAGGGAALARVLQGAAALAALAAVIRLWRRDAPLSLRAGVLPPAILLTTPHAVIYDLALLALPLAWLGWEACQEGRARDIWPLALVWLSPFAAAALADTLALQVEPLVLLFLMGWIVRRGEPASGAKMWSRRPRLLF
jgi:hypothetical protein